MYDADLRNLLIECDSELSAICHGRPPSDKQALQRLYSRVRACYEAMPKDSEELITEDWLRSIESELQAAGVGFHIWRNVLTDEWEPHHFSIEHRPDDGEGPIFIPCKMVKTRGRFRCLLSSLTARGEQVAEGERGRR